MLSRISSVLEPSCSGVVHTLVVGQTGQPGREPGRRRWLCVGPSLPPSVRLCMSVCHWRSVRWLSHIQSRSAASGARADSVQELAVGGTSRR